MDGKRCPFCGILSPSNEECYCFLDEEEDDECFVPHFDGSNDITHKIMNTDYNPVDFSTEDFQNASLDSQQSNGQDLQKISLLGIENEGYLSMTNILSENASLGSSINKSPIMSESRNQVATNTLPLGSLPDAEAVSVAGPSGIHSQSHRTVKEKRFVCDVCGKDFRDKYNLHAHHRTHTGGKPFVCHTCNKRFTQQADHTRHLRTHTGEKPYKCKLCGMAFATRGNCNAHYKRKHGGK
ncbi:Zinc finger and BTB domain-containing protein 49 [Araneus ventricosus]|uniref:Zinc finger and BTB domain-containing protein 49 n=1 Tax=Araneus ventricosus TaxID=182803 RepID=A0A4Y2L4H8_ARAVE|nr:Zinc finger and BTB domain-containing protein 49 [Araneus ventricosus]